MSPEVAVRKALEELVGHPLDDQVPALTVLAARTLTHSDVEQLVAQGMERADLLAASGLALEVIFTIDGEPGPWVWRLTLAEEDLPQPGPELGAYLADELTWRLLEWRDTRGQRRLSAAPRLLQAS